MCMRHWMWHTHSHTPVHEPGHHSPPALMSNSLPPPLSSCQCLENDLRKEWVERKRKRKRINSIRITKQTPGSKHVDHLWLDCSLQNTASNLIKININSVPSHISFIAPPLSLSYHSSWLWVPHGRSVGWRESKLAPRPQGQTRPSADCVNPEHELLL